MNLWKSFSVSEPSLLLERIEQTVQQRRIQQHFAVLFCRNAPPRPTELADDVRNGRVQPYVACLF
jgi:hypothetical protein